MSKTRTSLVILDALLVVCAIAAAPLFYFGSLILLGLGHGSTLFYRMYDTPPWVGFVLPTVAGMCAALGSHRSLRWVALAVAILSLAGQAWAVFGTDWDTYTIRKLYRMWPILTVTVGVGGAIIALWSIVRSIYDLCQPVARGAA